VLLAWLNTPRPVSTPAPENTLQKAAAPEQTAELTEEVPA
jgi:hypothetical protein